MESMKLIFGNGENLSMLQMSCRGIIVFIIALILIRISGRRSFGIKNPLDNIITISLGAILSRAIVGASPFIPVVFTCLTIVLLHRLISRLVVSNEKIAHLLEGTKILLFEDGHFLPKNLKRALVCEADIYQGLRHSAFTESLTEIDKIYLEKNGKISAVRKSKD